MDQYNNVELTIDNLNLDSEKTVYIAIPKIIFKRTDLNQSEKMLYSLILGLSRNQYKESNASTKYLASILNLDTRTIQIYVNNLKDKGLITWRKKGPKRFFSPLYWDKDAYALITSDVLKKTSISNAYKLAYGRLVSLSLNNPFGGFNYADITEIANDMGVSNASVYRYIAELKSQSLIKRDTTTPGHRYIPLDKYSVKKAKEFKARKDKLDNMASIDMLPHEVDITDKMLDKIYKGIK